MDWVTADGAHTCAMREALSRSREVQSATSRLFCTCMLPICTEYNMGQPRCCCISSGRCGFCAAEHDRLVVLARQLFAQCYEKAPLRCGLLEPTCWHV